MENIDELTAVGRRLFQISDRVEADNQFKLWDEAVGNWLSDNFPKSGLSAKWSSLGFSDLTWNSSVGSSQEEWHDFRKTIRIRLEWLANLPKLVDIGKEIQIDPMEISPVSKSNLELPEKVTLAWLWEKVPAKFWGWLIGILLAIFLAGISVGQIEFVKALFGEKTSSVSSQKAIETVPENVGQKGEIISSSSIEVYLKIMVDQELTDFSGTIASRSEKCFLETKSGDKVAFISSPGSTRMTRSGKQYQFSFVANLPLGHNVYRSTSEEIIEAKEAIIPLSAFVSLIKKKLPKESVLVFEFMEVSLYVNGNRVSKGRYSKRGKIKTDSAISISLNNV